MAFVPNSLMQPGHQRINSHGGFYVWQETPEFASSYYVPHLNVNSSWKNSWVSNYWVSTDIKAFINLPGDGYAPLLSPQITKQLKSKQKIKVKKIEPWEIYVYEIHGIDDFFNYLPEQKDYLVGDDVSFWNQVYQDVWAFCKQEQFFPHLGLEFDRENKLQITRTVSLISAEFNEKRAMYLRAMPSAAYGIQLAYQKPALNEHSWSPELVLEKGIEHIVKILMPALYSTFNRLSQVKEDSIIKLAAPTEWSIFTQFENFNKWKSENIKPSHWALSKLTLLLEPPKTIDDEWLLSLGICVEQQSETFVSLENFWQMEYAQYPAKFKEDHPLLELWLLERLHGAAQHFAPLAEDLQSHLKPVSYLMDLEQVCEYIQFTGPLLESIGCNTLLPEPIRRRQRATATLSISAPKSVLSMDSLLEQSYSLTFDGEELTPEELKQILNARRPLINLRGKWQLIDPTQLDELIKTLPKKNHTTLKEVLALQADSTYALQAAPQIEQLLNTLESPKQLTLIDLPSGINGTLRPYQHLGVSWLSFLREMGMPALLADDMGLGKTLQVLVHLLDGHQEGQKYLLIAPLSLLASWPKEGQKFTPALRIGLHHGLNRARTLDEIHEVLNGLDILLTTYGTLRSDIELLHQVPFTTVILDEAQAIKNPLADITQAVTRLNANHRIALTGTPIENRPLDIWSLFNFLLPNYLGDSRSFRTRFENPIANQGEEAPERLALLQRLVQPFLLRRIKEEVAQDLPPKVILDHQFLLTAEQVELYKRVVKKATEDLGIASAKDRQACILSSITHLKQVCNHPAQYLKEPASAFVPERSQKMALVLDIIEQCLEREESVLLFSQYTDVTNAMHLYLKKLGILTYLIEGKTTASQRNEQIDLFQSATAPPGVFVISLAAGGAGLNLQRANNAIFFDKPWNPAKERQAMDRAHRIGQVKKVFVHRLICTGTIEERIDDILIGKRELADELLSGVQDESWMSGLTNAKFLDLIQLKHQEGI